MEKVSTSGDVNALELLESQHGEIKRLLGSVIDASTNHQVNRARSDMDELTELLPGMLLQRPVRIRSDRTSRR